MRCRGSLETSSKAENHAAIWIFHFATFISLLMLKYLHFWQQNKFSKKNGNTMSETTKFSCKNWRFHSVSCSILKALLLIPPYSLITKVSPHIMSSCFISVYVSVYWSTPSPWQHWTPLKLGVICTSYFLLPGLSCESGCLLSYCISAKIYNWSMMDRSIESSF